jgi:hypothetical protein
MLYTNKTETNTTHLRSSNHHSHLHLAATGERNEPSLAFLELVLISSRRCSTFLAEAAVLVLVFGILDLALLKGKIEIRWIAGAFALSLTLLASSIAMDFAAHRWSKAHP